MHPLKHFRTITKHRHTVLRHCFRVGLYWRGLLHDLSKYSPTEFLPGAKYYQGTRSPNTAEREANGFSRAWIHHKGRNKHHYEYWTDLDLKTKQYVCVPMPTVFFAEMVMDRIAASKIYKGKDYTDASALEYLTCSAESRIMHPDTRKKLEFILTMLRDKGEKETFAFIRKTVLKGKPFGD